MRINQHRMVQFFCLKHKSQETINNNKNNKHQNNDFLVSGVFCISMESNIDDTRCDADCTHNFQFSYENRLRTHTQNFITKENKKKKKHETEIKKQKQKFLFFCFSIMEKCRFESDSVLSDEHINEDYYGPVSFAFKLSAFCTFHVLFPIWNYQLL